MLEAKGLATAMIATSEFVVGAEAQRGALGMTSFEPVVITHPLSSLTDAEIAQRIEEALPQTEAVWFTGSARGADKAQ